MNDKKIFWEDLFGEDEYQDIDEHFAKFRNKINEQNVAKKNTKDDYKPFKSDYNPIWKQKFEDGEYNTIKPNNLAHKPTQITNNAEVNKNEEKKVENSSTTSAIVENKETDAPQPTVNNDQIQEPIIFHQINTKPKHNYKVTEFDEAKKIIEASLYVMGEDGLSLSHLKRILDLDTNQINRIIAELQAEKDNDPSSGLCIRKYGQFYRLLTKPETFDKIQYILNTKERKPLNKGNMEVLSIIANNNCCTRRLIENIRGKDSTNALMTLIELGLVSKTIDKHTIGRPRLYSVTNHFFNIFGLRSLAELPKIERTNNDYVQKLLNDTQDYYYSDEDDDM